jgi:hypothetical protein
VPNAGGAELSPRAVMSAAAGGATDGDQSGVNGQDLTAHGRGVRSRGRGDGRGRLIGPAKTRTNYTEEFESREHFGLDFSLFSVS